jgi:hypothetical protein
MTMIFIDKLVDIIVMLSVRETSQGKAPTDGGE